MFIIRFLRWLLGWVEFEAEGGFPERLLNLAARGGIPLWDTGRRGVVLTARCFARKYKKLRPIARKAGVRLHVVRRHGVPFFLHRYRARAGLVAGLATYVVLLQILSQQIWVMQVSGNRKVSEADILSVMEELGVHKGGRMKDLDIQALQIEALQKLPDLVWLTVNPEGAIAHIEVAERQPPPAVIDKSAPSNIKASRDGRIVRMEVYGGQAAVKEGDAVVRGMLLVSGVVDTSVGPVMRKSNAKIFAETSRSLEVSVPLKETKLLPDGYRILRPTFHLFQFGIPLYTDGPLEGEFQLVEKPHFLTAKGLQLPLGIVNQYYHRLVTTEINRTEEEAAALARQLLEEKERSDLTGADIRERQLQGTVRDGQYVLTARYACVEDIGFEEAILTESK